jgi:hypothetical protein
MSGMTGASTNKVLDVMAELLERQLVRQSDDLDGVWQLGRLLQAVRVESHVTAHGDDESR